MNIEKFKKWLEQQGCEILQPTNQYELVRFKGKEVGILYTTGSTNGKYASDAIKSFSTNGLHKWDGAPVSTGRQNSYRKEKKQLLARDGTKCFYCGEELGEDITLEHLIALAGGGSNTLSNMVLAHEKCNQNANTMPVYKKMEVAVMTRIALLGNPPIPVELLYLDSIPLETLSTSGSKTGRIKGGKQHKSNKPKSK